MWRAVLVLCVLSLAGQSEQRHAGPVLELPVWTEPAPADLPADPVVEEPADEAWTLPETPFSDFTLAAILSRTFPVGLD